MNNTLYTVGHSNSTLEKLLSLLKLADVNCIIDVRSTPASAYSPHFNKESLQRFLKANGILYGHLELVEGLVRRFEEELGYKCHKVLTGGNANYIKDIISKDFILDLDLAIEGLNIILEKNKGI